MSEKIRRNILRKSSQVISAKNKKKDPKTSHIKNKQYSQNIQKMIIFNFMSNATAKYLNQWSIKQSRRILIRRSVRNQCIWGILYFISS